ncbi:SDR family NAD(P)-dependent oxidoreductase [Sphaerisporangium dianthi]|uniref:SDR family NAD(P)-dependent oxidoreductase n=1 Tax=Sphaerisporangium dianthi TaxID=1436120 RepID=A0ABV9CPZ8_9ACTN
MSDPGEVERWIVGRLAALTGRAADDIDPTDTFAGHGLASVELVSLLAELEDRLGAPVDPAVAYRWATPAALAAGLAGAGPAPARDGPDAGHGGVPHDPVVIVGVACRFPGGADTPQAYWDNLVKGVHAVTEIPASRWHEPPAFDPDRPTSSRYSYTRQAAFLTDVAGFDAALFGLTPQEALRTDPQHRLLMELVWEALENAGMRADGLAGQRTGVFAGLMDSGQYARLQREMHGAGPLTDPYFGLGAAPSVAAGRIAHRLDLRGPAVTIDTACSSALVALHLGAQSLRRGETDLVIAAAASLILHPDAFVQGCAMSMLARDGRCKTFDAEADGFAMGEGGGAVILERMSDAIRHGHRIRAVLLGSAVNQDGRSNGLTAPNMASQTAVIRDALADAGVAPQEVAFVEAHGSGTPLGDEIELSALREVFGQAPRTAPLWVGAVKTQVGHLLAAAGMAGLIKTVLALEHGELPPNLHLDTPNGAVEPDGPVRPAPGRLELPPASAAAVAGVSSFGWSGTNAHCVLQAPPAGAVAPAAASDASLLLLSAASPEALQEQAAALARHLAEAPASDLADVARTLDEGRTRLPARRALVAADTADAVAQLSAAPFVSGHVLRHAGHRPRVAYLLPGVGDHHQGMGRELYATEPAFADVVDRCLDVLARDHGVDLAPLLFADPEPARPDADAFAALVAARPGAAGEDPLTRARLSHPYVFTVEMAMAALLGSRGVRPAALLGYSLGEYSAACLAGVFTLEDALAVVVRRARLIETVPRGAMLAVAAAPDDLGEVLAAGPIAIAALNGPAMTVLSGTAVAVAEAARRLADRGVASVRMRSDHAFHSPLLEPVRSELAAVIAGVARSAPSVPIVSNTTGTWLTDEDATSPRYWADHLCRPVRYAQGAAELRRFAGVLVEVGPGATLGTLLRQNGLAGPDGVVVATLRSPGERRTRPGPGAGERGTVLRALGDLWERGAGEPGHGGAGRIVSLPTYPFQRSRHWPEPDPDAASPLTRAAPPGLLTYVPEWTRDGLRPAPDTAPAPAGRHLILADPDGIGAHLAARLRAEGGTVLEARPGDGYHRRGDLCTIDPADAGHYRRLVAELDDGPGPVSVVHLWSLVPGALFGDAAHDPDATLDGALRHGFDSLLLLTQALGVQVSGPDLCLLTVSAGCAEVIGGDAPAPERAVVHGFGRSLTHEYQGARWSGLDVDTRGGVAERARQVHEELRRLRLGEQHTGPGALVAWRREHRWTRAWRPETTGARLPIGEGATAWRPDGVYLITGGTRGLGLALARELARAGVRRLALLGRGPLPPLADLPAAARAGDERLARTARGVAELTALGAHVLLLGADAGDPDQLRRAVGEARSHFGALHGVVHAAGVPGGGLIQHKTPAQARTVLAPKVAALGPLLELIGPDVPKGERLELLLCYSSVAGEVGGPGESDYGAANAVLDAFAAAVDEPAGTRVCSVLWGPWRHDAWQSAALAHSPALAQAVRDYRERHGIGEAEGSARAASLAAQGRSTVMVVGEPLDLLARRWARLHTPPTAPFAGEAGGEGETAEAGRHPRPVLRQAYVAPRNALERQVARVWSAYLGIGEIGVHDPFFDLGGNSLVGMSIVRALEEQLQVSVPPAALFEHPTIAELATRMGGEPDGAEPLAAGERGRRRRQARAGNGGERRRGGTA